jgi:sugar phosphate isomerase/epimerase
MTRPIALAAGCALDADPTALIAAAGAAGFDAVGLRASGDHAVGDPGAVRAVAAAAGVSIHDVEVHRIGAESSDAAQLFETAHAIGATSVLVVSDLVMGDDTVRELARLTERCRELGLVLGLEYMAWTHPSAPSAAVDVARRTGCRLVVDVLHHIRVGADVDDLRAIVDAGVLGWLQLCDAPIARPAHDDLVHEARHERLPPGHGGLPLSELLAEVPDDVVVSVEVQSDRLVAELDVAARAVRLYDASVRVLSHRG